MLKFFLLMFIRIDRKLMNGEMVKVLIFLGM